ncbi:GNAT family N-acetyltransferase [Streptococcus suis]|uniref:GNAT family N-acetyltransferase n=1 Tax=Streptococcus suis TaxID=1307 RepID=UPI001ABDE57C|nr:GNAT family N-acetyltransferase [Streptococcus suis]
MLVKADLSNAEELLPIQYRAFAALYETYHDQYNPAIETMDYFQSRFARPNCTYYKIIEEEHTVGLVQTTVAEDTDQGWLGLIGINPVHRGKGYDHKAMLELESLYPIVKRWVLCTVLQEPRLVAFYEKLDYKAIRTEPEQEGTDMVYMEKWLGGG